MFFAISALASSCCKNLSDVDMVSKAFGRPILCRSQPAQNGEDPWDRRTACCPDFVESSPGLSITTLPLWRRLPPIYPVLAGCKYPAAVSTTLLRVHQWRVQNASPALLQRGQARLDRPAAAAALEQQHAPWAAARRSRAALADRGSRRAAPPPVLQGKCARPRAGRGKCAPQPLVGR